MKKPDAARIQISLYDAFDNLLFSDTQTTKNIEGEENRRIIRFSSIAASAFDLDAADYTEVYIHAYSCADKKIKEFNQEKVASPMDAAKCISLKKLFGIDAVCFPKAAADKEGWLCVCGCMNGSGQECRMCKRKKENVVREGMDPEKRDDGFEQFCLLFTGLEKPADAIQFVNENLKYFTFAQSEFLLAKLDKELQMWKFYSATLKPQRSKEMLDEALKLS